MAQKRCCKSCGTREKVTVFAFITGTIPICSRAACYNKVVEQEQERVMAWQE